MKKYNFSKTEAAILERSAVPMAVYQFIDKRVVTVLVSDGFMELFGFAERADAVYLMDNDMYRDTHPDDVARIADEAVRFATEGGEYNVVYRSKKNDSKQEDDYNVIHAFGKHVFPKEGVRLAYVWYVNEGSYKGEEGLESEALTRNYSLSLYESSMQRKNSYDFLTGLPNMTYFFETATIERDKAHAKGESCSLIYANLNGMKFYNKKYGFSEGDKLLRAFAGVLSTHFGSENTCRIGQDNFACFAFSKSLEKKLEAVFAEFEHMVKPRKASVRVGIYPDTMGTVETSTACDRARYACNSLKNIENSSYAYFDNKMLEYENNRQYILDNIDRAIEEKWIQAFYQPIVRAANGRVCDEEALARWIDPVKGMLSPAQFIPVLEDSKLIYKVDLYIVDQIIEKIIDQRKKGLFVVPMSVNLSRTDFDVCDIVSEITKKMDDAGIGREMLTIEITESVVGSDFEFIKEQVERFQKLGFKVWMDDFGSGYSSLDVLQRIHFDLIKLDMRFMKQFDNDEKSRVIITEIMKMAFGLGIDTVAEGVERKDQMDFLAEVGCTKLQGYYFCKPISYAAVLERYEKGIQIGFENPAESDYYATIGRINLYDMAGIANEDSDSFERYFNMLPMAVIETIGDEVRVIRCNWSYREFLRKVFDTDKTEIFIPFSEFIRNATPVFISSLMQCAYGSGKAFINEKISADSSVHSFMRRLAVNPVTNVVAVALVVLGVMQEGTQTLSYADIAQSLSADYIYLYYVNLRTEEFTEYHSDPDSSNLAVERHGRDFFESSRKDAMEAIYVGDLNKFVNSFTKEKVMKSIDENGSYNTVYRLMMNGKPVYVSMKAVRMSNDPNYIIIGVSNVDTNMRQREAYERMKEEQTTYARISALAGNFICIYTVDPETDSYMSYDSTKAYDNLGLARYGEDFFNQSIKDSKTAIYSEDLPMFLEAFSKEKVLSAIEEKGAYRLEYRLMIDGEPVRVRLKAAKIVEDEVTKIIIGVSREDGIKTEI